MRFVIFPVVAMLVLFALACGGGDGSPVDGGGDAAAATADGNTSAPNGGDDAPEPEDTPESNGGGDGGPSLGSGSDLCPALVGIFVDPDLIADVPLGELETLIGDLTELGPSEIRDDLRIYNEALVPFFDLLEELGANTPAGANALAQDDQERLSTLTSSIRTAEFETAENNIEAYIDREC